MKTGRFTVCPCLKNHINAVTIAYHFQATEDVQEGLTDDDYDMYYEIWQQFDPDGTQYLRWETVSSSKFIDC